MNKNLKLTRQFLGIFIVFMGSPLIFFAKEVSGFGGGSGFTVASLILGLALMVSPSELFRKFHKPFLPTYRLAVIFLSIALINFIFINPFYGYTANSSIFFRDLLNYVSIFIFFILLLGVSNDVKEYFLPIIVFFTFLGSVCLIYSMATNANFIIGQRASVVFGDGSTTASGNPHVYARNAFAGIFSSYIMLKNKNTFWKLFAIVNMILSLVVLILAQARSILLAFFFTMVIFIYYNVSAKSVKKAFINIFKPQNLFLLSLIFSGIMYFISTQAKLVAIINLYYDGFSVTFTKAILTATGMEDAKTIDYSAMGRVTTFADFKKILLETPWELILGKGYKFLYMDIPILQTWIDCGIIAFWSFAMMNLLLFRESLRAIKDGTNQLTTFLGYFYMCYFVTLFTGGEPYGIAYWFVFLVMIRFLGVRYLQKIPAPLLRKEQNTSPEIST